jgi:hypothetical protein
MSKVLKSIVLAAAAVAVGTMAQAGLFSSAVSDLPTQESTGYRVEAYGWDVRVYEFTPVTADNVLCVMAFGSNGAVGLTCVVLPE